MGLNLNNVRTLADFFGIETCLLSQEDKPGKFHKFVEKIRLLQGQQGFKALSHREGGLR